MAGSSKPLVAGLFKVTKVFGDVMIRSNVLHVVRLITGLRPRRTFIAACRRGHASTPSVFCPRKTRSCGIAQMTVVWTRLSNSFSERFVNEKQSKLFGALSHTKDPGLEYVQSFWLFCQRTNIANGTCILNRQLHAKLSSVNGIFLIEDCV